MTPALVADCSTGAATPHPPPAAEGGGGRAGLPVTPVHPVMRSSAIKSIILVLNSFMCFTCLVVFSCVFIKFLNKILLRSAVARRTAEF